MPKPQRASSVNKEYTFLFGHFKKYQVYKLTFTKVGMKYLDSMIFEPPAILRLGYECKNKQERKIQLKYFLFLKKYQS